MKQDSIYTITIIDKKIKSIKTVGFFYNFSEAFNTMNDFCYELCDNVDHKYVVIEEVIPGIYLKPKDSFWYEWNNSQEKYIPIERPFKFNKFSGYSMMG